MLFTIGLILGGLAAWLAFALFETSWEDIFPDQ